MEFSSPDEAAGRSGELMLRGRAHQGRYLRRGFLVGSGEEFPVTVLLGQAINLHHSASFHQSLLTIGTLLAAPPAGVCRRAALSLVTYALRHRHRGRPRWDVTPMVALETVVGTARRRRHRLLQRSPTASSPGELS
jgi:hypothetical protein